MVNKRPKGVFPNTYKVSFEDFKGRKKSRIVKALTGAEAIIRVRSTGSVSNKNFTVRLIKR